MRGTLRIGAVQSIALDEGAGDAAMLLRIGFDEAAHSVTGEGVSGNLEARVNRLDVTAELVNEIALWVQRRHGMFGGVSCCP